MAETTLTTEDVRRIASLCLSVTHVYATRGPHSSPPTVRELQAIQRLRDALAAIDRETVPA